MEKVIKDGYVFDIDMERTKNFYSYAPQVFNRLFEYLPELTHFLASLGIDIEKPLKYDLNNTYDLLYRTFGSCTSKEGYELDFYGENKYVSVVIYNREVFLEIEVLGITSPIKQLKSQKPPMLSHRWFLIRSFFC